MMGEKIIASFDIGIRHLAYCILSYHPDKIPGNQFHIYDWNVLDLLNVDPKQSKTCQTTIKSGPNQGTLCTHDTYFVNTSVTPPVSVCKIHAKSCDRHQLQRYYTVNNIHLFELSKLAIRRLDQIDFGQCVEIVLESQPYQLMKNFSMMLFDYFVIRYIAEKPDDLQVLENVKFISARNKLNVYDGPYIECHLKQQYARNKFYSKKYCEYLIRYNPDKLQFFDSFKKKDDLADSMLLGAWELLNGYKSTHVKPKIKITSNSLKLPSSLIEDPQPAPQDTQLVPKYKLVLKSHPVGRAQLKAIRHNATTRQVMVDYQGTKYRHLKSKRKPKDSQRMLTLSNLKYVIESHQLKTEEAIRAYDDPRLVLSIVRYFKNVETFVKLISV